MKTFLNYLILFMFGPVLLGGCLPIPQIRLSPSVPDVTYRVKPASVQTEYIHLPGFPEPSTPSEFNQTMYTRYFVAEEADTILVLMPGIFGGASSFDLLARQLVAALPNTEVWAVDRRANLLEDRSLIKQSLSSHDPMPAYNYYIKNAKQDNGFKPVAFDDLGFMRNWGLEVHLYDLHEIIKHARSKAQRIILGGHSFGASMISFYSSFIFPDGVGQDFIEGMVLIDGVLGRTGGFAQEVTTLRLGSFELLPGLEDLKAGRGAPYSALLLPPESYARREALSLLARFDPEGLAPEGLETFPLTNMAVVGIHDDDSYSNFIPFSSSFGEAVGATFSGNLGAALLAGTDGFYSKSVSGVAAGYDVVSWRRDDSSIVSPSELMEAWATPDTNRSEWYFPLRLALEVPYYDMRLENVPGYLPTKDIRTPTLAVGAGRGMVTSLESFAAYNNLRMGSLFSMYILPGYTHLDIIYAERNPLVGMMKVWLGGLE